jgi:hypothetical protein
LILRSSLYFSAQNKTVKLNPKILALGVPNVSWFYSNISGTHFSQKKTRKYFIDAALQSGLFPKPIDYM